MNPFSVCLLSIVAAFAGGEITSYAGKSVLRIQHQPSLDAWIEEHGLDAWIEEQYVNVFLIQLKSLKCKATHQTTYANSHTWRLHVHRLD